MVGITGSVGKTTTKDLLRRCLASAFVTAASERSFNNELGLPLTLLNAPDDVEWVVLEMGARGAGHIAPLGRVGRPDVGIVTSVAMAHVEYLRRSRRGGPGEERARDRAAPTGVAVLNFDDPLWRAWRRSARARSSATRVGGDAEVRAERVVLDDELRPRFHLSTPWGAGEVRLALHGIQQVPNALAAAAAALWCGVPFDGVVAALGTATGSPLRMEVRRRPGRARPGRRLLQRQPGFDRGGAAVARRAAGRPEAGPARAHGRAGGRDRGRAPAGGPVGRGARDRGRRLPDRSLRPGRR